jgi:outer membrane protein OmpA-like peptidoglycan-associated protein
MFNYIILILSFIYLLQCSSSKEAVDGRFTLGIGAGSGTGTKRLMYGYPSPRSTSFFVLKIGDKLASNSPNFCEATYISGTEENDYYTGVHSVKFKFLDVEVEQLLIPTDEKLEHVTTDISPKYYRVEYNIINSSKNNQTVGLAVLIDTMIDDNDGPKVAVYTGDNKNLTHIEEETGFRSSDIPTGVMLFQNGTDTNSLTGNLVLRGADITSPDELLLGSWPYFIHRAWGINPRNTRYLDSAALIRWKDKVVNVNESKSFSFYYGMANKSTEGLDAIFKDIKLQETKSNVKYEKGEIALTDTQKKYIDELFLAAKGRDIAQVTVEGYADATGTDSVNEVVSKKRALNVQDYIAKTYRVKKEIIIIKPMSSSVARKRDDDLQNGNPEDRKVEVSIATKEKAAKTDNSANITKKNFKVMAEKAQYCNFVFKNGQIKKGKLLKMKEKFLSANIDNVVREINKKEIKTIKFIN